MKLGYVLGSYDVLRAKDLKELDKQIQLSKDKGNTHFALGIYEEELTKILTGNTPIKSVEDRMKIAEQLRGIDFVFSVSSLDKNIVKNSAIKALEESFKKEKSEEIKEKKYKIAYAPGTYDLFHAGHLENLMIAASQSEFLIAGVKADELVKKNKNRNPVLPEEERAEILRHFKFIGDTYTFYTPKHLTIADKWIQSKYDKKTEAFFMGSDLIEAVSGYKGLNIVFTDRNPEKMKTRSTTYYRTVYLGNDYDGKYKSKDLNDKVKESRESNQEKINVRNDEEER